MRKNVLAYIHIYIYILFIATAVRVSYLPGFLCGDGTIYYNIMTIACRLKYVLDTNINSYSNNNNDHIRLTETTFARRFVFREFFTTGLARRVPGQKHTHRNSGNEKTVTVAGPRKILDRTYKSGFSNYQLPETIDGYNSGQ